LFINLNRKNTNYEFFDFKKEAMILGKGGFGKVCLMVDLNKKAIWAIKYFENEQY